MRADPNEHNWDEYYRAVEGRPVRQLLIDAVEKFESPGFAIDVGCGGGIETRELLRRGWEVLALDREESAFEYLRAGLSESELSRLTTRRVSFAELELPPADLIWAGLSLPFCEPDQFSSLWHTITDAVRPGGRFAGDLFGVRHVWRSNPEMTFLTSEQMENSLHEFEIERMTEVDEDRPTAFEGMQHWHACAVVARKPHKSQSNEHSHP